MITENEILEFTNSNQVISLIKEFRGVSGFGLKDSKDVIESCRKGSSSAFDAQREFNIDKLLAAFDPYINPKTPEQIESERLDKIEQERIQKEQIEIAKRQRQISMRQNMINGIQIAFDNFESLGFDTPFYAIQSVIDRFQQKWDD